MVQYNKYIITKKKENPLEKLEKKYGKIITYNYDNIKEYNNLSNHFFEKTNVVGGLSSSDDEDESSDYEYESSDYEDESSDDEEESSETSYTANGGKKRKINQKNINQKAITQKNLTQEVNQGDINQEDIEELQD